MTQYGPYVRQHWSGARRDRRRPTGKRFSSFALPPVGSRTDIGFLSPVSAAIFVVFVVVIIITIFFYFRTQVSQDVRGAFTGSGRRGARSPRPGSRFETPADRRRNSRFRRRTGFPDRSRDIIPRRAPTKISSRLARARGKKVLFFWEKKKINK